jgi:hypothetical protein
MSARAARFAFLALLWLLAAAPAVHAQSLRAWLDRDRIALGETATLNIEIEGAAAAEPDWSPLLGDFEVTGNTSSRSLVSDASGTRMRTRYSVDLQPRREGVLEIPALSVGARRTQPLSLAVTAPSATPARAGAAAFIESEADAQSPYVQQAVGYVVRLYIGVPLVSGTLDQPDPEGASLRQVGDDVRYQRDLQGRHYTVIERHYLLLPERSGTLSIPGARFTGRGVGGFFDDMFGNGQRTLAASGAAQALSVRAIPAAAAQPWLPLQALSLRWTQAPADARAGAAATVTLEAVADGATAAQLPALELPPVAGAQVFPDPPQRDEAFVDGRPQATIVRSFAIVPAKPGTLRIDAPRLSWWDARTGVQRVATLPPLSLAVATGAAPGPGDEAGAAGTGTTAAPASSRVADAAGGGWMRVPGVQGRVRPWAFAAVAFALLWLITFMWGLHRHPHRQAAASGNGRVDDRAKGAGVPAASARAAAAPLRRALAEGTLGDVADALRAAAYPPVGSLDEVRARLGDAAQQAAVEGLQRALWGGGDGSVARAALRTAFASGPRWAARPDAPARSPLPPLYP